MIRAKFYRAGDGSLHASLSGHAGTAPKGRDLVCAAASGLAMTLGSAVEQLYYSGMLRRCPKIELGEGCAEIIAQPKPRCEQAAMMVFWTVQNGITQLAKGWPENVTVEEMMTVG